MESNISLSTLNTLSTYENLSNCQYWSYYDITAPNTLLLIILIILLFFGLIIGVAGYRWLRVSLFITTFLFFCILFSVIFQEDPYGIFSKLSLLNFKLPILLVSSVVIGVISILVPYIGIIWLGGLVGIILSAFFISFAPFLFQSYIIWFPVGMFIIFSIFFLTLLFFFTKPISIVSFAVSASATLIFSMDLLLDQGTLVFYTYECYFHGDEGLPFVPLCWLTWMLFALFIILTPIFVIIQIFITVQYREKKLNTVCSTNTNNTIKPENIHAKRHKRFCNDPIIFNIEGDDKCSKACPRYRCRSMISACSTNTCNHGNDEDQKQQHIFRVRNNYGDVVSKSQLEVHEACRSQPSSLLLSPVNREARDDENVNQNNINLLDDVSLIFTQTEELVE